MKKHILTFYFILILTSLSSKSEAQSLSIIPNLNHLITAKIDSATNLAPLTDIGLKLYATVTAFVKKPDYTKGKESPTPLPNAYSRMKDISIPIPTLKIQSIQLPK